MFVSVVCNEVFLSFLILLYRKKELPPHENGMIYSNGANGEGKFQRGPWFNPWLNPLCRNYIEVQIHTILCHSQL